MNDHRRFLSYLRLSFFNAFLIFFLLACNSASQNEEPDEGITDLPPANTITSLEVTQYTDSCYLSATSSCGGCRATLTFSSSGSIHYEDSQCDETIQMKQTDWPVLEEKISTSEFWEALQQECEDDGVIPYTGTTYSVTLSDGMTYSGFRCDLPSNLQEIYDLINSFISSYLSEESKEVWSNLY